MHMREMRHLRGRGSTFCVKDSLYFLRSSSALSAVTAGLVAFSDSLRSAI